MNIGTCSSCEYWDHDPKSGEEYDKYYGETTRFFTVGGDCRCPRVMYRENESFVTGDEAFYWDSEGHNATFFTGPLFGCVHHSPREK